jgi:hypothetical protein
MLDIGHDLTAFGPENPIKNEKNIQRLQIFYTLQFIAKLLVDSVF